MKKFFQSAAPLILAVLAVIIINFYIQNREIRKSNNILGNENTVIQIQVDSLLKQDKEKQIKIDSVDIKFNSLIERLPEKDKKILTFKKSENEKLHIVDSLHSNELFDLFAGIDAKP